jgi:hypothetical protein
VPPDCADKAAALERDEADTVLIEKINIAEILRLNSEPAKTFAFFPPSGKPSSGREPTIGLMASSLAIQRADKAIEMTIRLPALHMSACGTDQQALPTCDVQFDGAVRADLLGLLASSSLDE